MTHRQRQALLQFLGYYVGEVDNIWGAMSRIAMEAFQRDHGLPATGRGDKSTDTALLASVAKWEPDVTDTNVGNKTGTFWDDIEFFDREEFRCQCKGKYCDGFPAEPQEEMVRAVNEIRRRLGIPVTIVDSGGSGVRCPRHNAAVGGVANSLHMSGNAADLHSGASPDQMAKVAEEVMGKTGEIGIYDWGIHVGIGEYSRWDNRR